MKLTKQEIIDWYTQRGISKSRFKNYDNLVKGMIGIEAIADDWTDVEEIRETGIPADAVLLFFEPNGVDLSELQESDDKIDYLLLNTNSENLKQILKDDIVTVVGIKSVEGCIRVECEAKGSEIIEG